jgi:tetratricopeptide (TPR) repeat protein
VFVGGCTLEAIEAVCNATEDLGIDVLAGVSALVDNSLLTPRTSGDEQSRFFMLETVREYASERLDASGETPATRRAHAAYALVVAEEESSGMAPADREAWLLWCDREHDNLRAAMQYLVATGEAEWALRLGAALFRFWEQREYLTEGREALAAALAIPAPSPPGRARAAALYNACLLADIQCDRVTAQAMVRQAHAIYETLGDIKGVATTMPALARQAHVRGRHAEARSLLEETVRLWDLVGERAAADMARSNIATFAKAEGDYDLARSLFEQLVTSASARGDRRAVASALNELGDLAARSDDALARRHHYDALAIFREIGDHWGIARVLTDVAHVEIAAGHHAAAEDLLKEALQLARELGHQRGVARRLELLSWCAARQSRYAAAVRLAGAAAVIRERIGVPAEPAEGQKLEGTTREARRALGRGAYERAWTTGRTMTIDQVLASEAGAPP